MGERAVESVQTPEYDLLLQQVRNARAQAHLSQRELSRRLRKANSYIGKIESGTRRLDLVELFRLLRALDHDPAVFLSAYLAELNS